MPSRIVLPIGVVLLLQGCANSPIAQDLETRFSDPVPMTGQSVEGGTASASTPLSTASAAQETTAGVLEADDLDTSDEPVAPELTVELSEDPSTIEPSSVPPQQLQPYRITIRLSAADPSAPAEMVTRALRRSNVPFAVERIESIAPSP